ncbi:trypsin-7-like [Spodoptera litura]|uniref:trypsin n=1 Tax=Spodoptera litura TaxID=69820 RepID=A0A9J7EWC6_SPOLT|nr:trypsin-7-like [Spodoptera litura]
MGGYEIKISNAPYQVNYGDVCGGALIHKKWAVTSAHCGIAHYYIRVRSSHRLKGAKIIISKHLIHPEYQLRHQFDYDIQLLVLLRPLHYTKLVSPIKMSNHFGKFLTVAGWGFQTEKGEYIEKLQQVQIKMFPMKECQEVNNKWYNHTLTPRMFCAGGWGYDACQGDSGGAAVSNGRLIGLSSFGFGCGRSMPGVYTNISDRGIREWIYEYTGV